MDTYSDNHAFIVSNSKAECDLLRFVQCKRNGNLQLQECSLTQIL